MKTINEPTEGSRIFTFSKDLPPAGKTEEKKVRFDLSAPRDKKYEGFSVSSGPRAPVLRTTKGEKENVKDKKLDEEFIHNLHQHIYYLEMQLKLLKDKEVESKKGGLDALFRDGIPLNEHFLALKNRYKKEKKELEDQLASLEKQIQETTGNNAATEKRIEMISEEYEQLAKQNDVGINVRYNKERELKGRLYDENRAIGELKDEIDKKSKELSQYKSNNAYMLRIQEKNKMFGENKEEKDLLEQERKNNDMIQHYLKKVIEAGIVQEASKKQYDDMTMIKELDNENMELIKNEAAINREIAIAKGKISELENMRELNVKYIEEEIAQKRKALKEQEGLQKELEHKSKLKEEELKEYLKEKEQSQISELQTKLDIGNSEIEYFIVFL